LHGLNVFSFRRYWDRLGEKHEKRRNVTGVISLEQDSLVAFGLGEFGQALVNA